MLAPTRRLTPTRGALHLDLGHVALLVDEVEEAVLALDAALAARDEGEPFDVILMDMQMPVMDGYGAADLLRKQGYSGPIIALTAHAMAEDRQKCLDAGCDDFATKPIDRHKLISLILRITDQQQAKLLVGQS